MPGFVDVSQMSDLEVKRLGQMDDVDPRDNPYAYRNLAKRNPYAYRKPKSYPPKVTFNHTAEDVWGAAVQAQSINGAYIKAIAPGIEQHETNRMIMERLLNDTTQITQESRDKGVLVRKYFQAFTFKVLQGKILNDFNKTAMDIANKDSITTNYDIAVVASLPASYDKGTVRDSVDRRINFATGGTLGNIGGKATTDIEVLKKVWSVKWNTWYITGITDDDKVLFFAYNHNIEIGDRVTIQGSVKSHRDNSTQLNRVKVIK
jgi:hypothetical protein